jgi:hypothetical protein
MLATLVQNLGWTLRDTHNDALDKARAEANDTDNSGVKDVVTNLMSSLWGS